MNYGSIKPSQEQLKKLKALFQGKRYFEAEKLALFLIKKFPKHHVSWDILGLIFSGSGRPLEALRAIKKSVEFNPKSAQAHYNLGNAYKSIGKLKEAKESYSNSISLKQDSALIHFKLANVCLALSKLEEAESNYENAILLRSNFTEAHFNLGITLNKKGKHKEAAASYSKAIQLKPNFLEAHMNLGITLMEMGSFEEAIKSYNHAIELDPNRSDSHFNLGNTLRKLDKLEEASRCFKKSISLNANHYEAQHNLGITLQMLRKIEKAEDCFKKVIELKPDYTAAHLDLAWIKKFHSKDVRYIKMKELYIDSKISIEQRCHINFGLAKAYEDLNKLDDAFKHYSEGNLLRKKFLNYEISQDINLFKQIKLNYPNIKKCSLRKKNFSSGIIPVFIIGMPRSGTTLVEQIISSHSEVTGAGELPFIAQFGGTIARDISSNNPGSIVEFRRNYLIKLESLSNSNFVVTDKMPQNFRFLGLIASAFPEAKIVHVKRNKSATCWSNYKQFFPAAGLGYSFSLQDIIQYYQLYQNLMNFWKDSIDNKIHEVEYESLTINQEKESKKLISYLDLNWDKKCLHPHKNLRTVSTASNLQVRGKVFKGASENWKKYKPFLKGALDFM